MIHKKAFRESRTMLPWENNNSIWNFCSRFRSLASYISNRCINKLAFIILVHLQIIRVLFLATASQEDTIMIDTSPFRNRVNPSGFARFAAFRFHTFPLPPLAGLHHVSQRGCRRLPITAGYYGSPVCLNVEFSSGEMIIKLFVCCSFTISQSSDWKMCSNAHLLSGPIVKADDNHCKPFFWFR